MRSMPWLAAAGATLIAMLVSLFVAIQPAHAAVGLHVSGTNIVESNGNRFIMRGVSHAHTWYPSQTGSFAGIKSLGANTVRVVLSGGRWTANTPSDVANVISLCKQNRLICVLENHDTTGYGEQGGAVTLDAAVNYWLSLQSVLAGQEDYVVINIGNEPIGNNAVTPGWADATRSAITRLRTAGFDHLLMVDAPNWGQDWQFTMRDNAATVFNADPDRNTVFSVHMYGVFDTAAEITDYLSRFATAGLPLVIGEFGHNHSDGDPDEDTIMAQAQSRGIGYIGWSWSGNSGGVEYLDMVTGFNASQLTSWGQRIFNGANGIRSTSHEATVYSGITPTSPTVTPTTPTVTPTSPTVTPTSGPWPCRVAYTMNSWNTGYTANITITNTRGAAINGWQLRFTLPSGQTLTNGWSATYSGSTGQITATNASWNGNLANGASTTIGFQATHTGNTAEPGSFALNGDPCEVV